MLQLFILMELSLKGCFTGLTSSLTFTYACTLFPTCLQGIALSPQYPSFLEHAINTFLKILSDGEPQFISEHAQQVRFFHIAI